MSQARRTGFTLIELLVVMSIIDDAPCNLRTQRIRVTPQSVVSAD